MAGEAIILQKPSNPLTAGSRGLVLIRGAGQTVTPWVGSRSLQHVEESGGTMPPRYLDRL